jgi:hypothetical protein
MKVDSLLAMYDNINMDDGLSCITNYSLRTALFPLLS